VIGKFCSFIFFSVGFCVGKKPNVQKCVAGFSLVGNLEI